MATTGSRPAAALAMHRGLVEEAFTAEQLERLGALVDLVDPEPLDDFSSPRARQVLPACEVLVAHWGCPPIDRAALDLAPHLRLVAYGAGSVRAIVTDALWERNVVVTSAAAANAVPVAEFTPAAILLANKGALLGREWYRDRALRNTRPHPVGNADKRVGLIAASRVGRAVIEALRPFDLEVVVSDPFLTPHDAAACGIAKVDLDELLTTSHVVSVHAPELPSTRHLLGGRELALLRDGAVLVNTARGSLVDTDALVAELRTGRISAVLDVTEPEPLPENHPLLLLPNAFVTPHLAGAQGSELRRLADLALTEVERFVRSEPPLHPVHRADLDRMA